MVITSFSPVLFDLGQQPHKACQIADSLGRLGVAHGASAHAAELRSRLIV